MCAAGGRVCRWEQQRRGGDGGGCRGPVCQWVLQRMRCVGGCCRGSVYWRLQRLAHSFFSLLSTTLTCMMSNHGLSFFSFSPCPLSSTFRSGLLMSRSPRSRSDLFRFSRKRSVRTGLPPEPDVVHDGRQGEASDQTGPEADRSIVEVDSEQPGQ